MKKIILSTIALLFISGCEDKSQDMQEIYDNSRDTIKNGYSKALNYGSNFANMTAEQTKEYAENLKNFANKNMGKIPLDTIISKIAGIGIPAVVIIGIASTTGVAGGAAIVGAISASSGGAGLIPGIVALGFIAVASQAIAEYGSEAVMKEVVKQLKEQGHTDSEIKEKVESYPISDSLKNDVLRLLNE